MGSWDLVLLSVKWESVADDIWHASNSKISSFFGLVFGSFSPGLGSHRNESESLKAPFGSRVPQEEYATWKFTLST